MNLKIVKSQHNITKIIFFSVFLISICLFTSCQNFLNGNSLKDEIEAVVDYSKRPYAKITITSEGVATASLVPAAGSYTDKYKPGDPIDLKFEANEGFNFIKWIATPSDAVEFFNENELSTTAIIKNAENPIIIQPYTLPKDKVTIHFSTDHGATVPAEEKQLYLSDEFALSYKEESGYAFAGWKVIDNVTKEEVSDVLEITGTGTDVIVKVLDVNKKVTIEAETIARPKVVSASPLYDTNGVYRDRPIVIMFNKEMSEKSIYWTEEELIQKGISIENAFEAIDKTYLDGEQQKKYFYAYWNGEDPNSIVYKNISIKKYTNDSINYLQYYGIPKFDDSNTRVLRIPTKIEIQNNEIICKAPPSATDILVTLSKNFFLEQDQNKINLSEEYSWTYSTNLDTDVFAPEFDKSSFKVTLADKDQTSYNSDQNLLNEEILQQINNSPATKIPAFNAKNKTFWVKGKFTDKGSGPGNLQWYITKVNSKYYPAIQNTLVAQGNIRELSVVGQNATIGIDSNANTETGGVLINVSDNLVNGYEDLPEGTYALYFEAFDKNGQGTRTEPYYFVYDITPPAASSVSYYSTIAKDVVQVTKSKNSTTDYYKTDVAGVEFTTASTKELRNLGASTRKHTITIKDYDYAGNYKTTTTEITAIPQVGYIFYDDCYWSSITDLDNAVKTGRTPVGIILGGTDASASNNFTDKVKIVAIERDSKARFVINDNWSDNFPYGWDDNDKMAVDGLKNYELIVNNSYGAIDHSEVHKYLYEEKNNFNRNKIIWYLPAVNEYLWMNGYNNNGFNRDRRNEFNTQLGILKSKGYTTLSTYAKIDGDNTSIQEIISSTIYKDRGYWAGATTYWYNNDFYTGFRKVDHPNLKKQSLYMAQVSID